LTTLKKRRIRINQGLLKVSLAFFPTLLFLPEITRLIEKKLYKAEKAVLEVSENLLLCLKI
jgi:hypothetical protein